jgi:hypothetical protein
MKTEPPTKKTFDKATISNEEWRSNRASLEAVLSEDASEMRHIIKKKLQKLAGREWCPTWANIKLAEILVKNGHLRRPDWHDRSTLVLDHFLFEDLSEVYTKVKASLATPVDNFIDPEDCPF